MNHITRYITAAIALTAIVWLTVLCTRSCSSDSSQAFPSTVDTINNFYTHLDSMPAGGCVKLKINPIGGSLPRVFNDSNYIHLNEAQAIGIKPISNPADAWHINRPLRHIGTCREYYLDDLTHSLPFLVPEAADLLRDIGQRFNDSLMARGGGSYRLKVTSVLRTGSSVTSLRRRNVNAVEASAHQYGTTFDISYAKFICDSVTVARTQEDLKNLLAEVLKQLRDEQRCYVKYERKQGCFHITARRPKNDNIESSSDGKEQTKES